VDTTVTPLSDDERSWVSVQLEAARQFVADYGSTRTLDLATLQHAWASWLDRQAVDPEDPEPVLNAVGVYFGQSLVDSLDGFDWVHTEDESGVDLAVFGLPGAGDVLIYPANVVAERYNSRDASFLVSGRDRILQQIADMRP
jgi:Domain of unknown function (DUF3806)